MQGLLLLNKPQGITSFGAVAAIKRIAGEKRVGHTGTLDPMATGVLPIFLGRATALSSYLLDADKCYTAKIRLGVTTDTCDITGTVISEMSVELDNADVIKALKGFVGKQEQIPPMYSAIKKDGVRLYELARKGIDVEIPKREIEIYSLEQTTPLDQNHEFDIAVKVSKGTYIRSLCRDIGNALGCGATLSALCRTNASGIDIDKCVSLDDLNSENISDYILNEETAVAHFGEVFVTEKQAIRFTNGGQLDYDRLKLSKIEDGTILRVKCGEKFLGLGLACNEKSHLAVKCVINSL